MVVLRALFLTAVLFFACWFTLPMPTTANPGHRNKHGGGSNGIETLLTAGVLASILQKKHHGGHGGHHHHHHPKKEHSISIGDHHEEHESRSPMPYAAQPMMPYYPHMAYGPQQMMPYGQPMMYPQQSMMPYMSQPQAQGSNQLMVGDFAAFQPTDKTEVIKIS